MMTSPTTAPAGTPTAVSPRRPFAGTRARLRARGRPWDRPWALALVLAVPLALAYLVWSPPAADLAAATYRSDLFARAGYALRDHGWYAAHGHYLLGYSLLSPPLGALLGVRLVMVLSVLASCVLFGLIAERVFPPAAARAAALTFAFGLCVELLSGRVPYDLGLALALASVLAAMRGRPAWALLLALLTSVASPVAGAFLALAYLAWGLTLWSDPPPSDRSAFARAPSAHSFPRPSPRARAHRAAGAHPAGATPPRSWAWPLALTLAALAPIAALALAFPEGGYEPFAPSSFWPALAGVIAIALLLPRGPLSARAHCAVRAGLVLYAGALIASFAIHTPVGSNAARLGPELLPALLVGVLWDRRRVALALLAPLLVFWQINTPVGDLSEIYGQPSVHASYYAPLLSELRRLRHGAPTIVEVPLTAAHWEAAYLAGHEGVSLARGWERQLDTRYAALFYRPHLSAAAYRAWLAENHVAFLALPDALPDYSSRAEVALVRGGLPYLREVWHGPHWRLYRFIG